MYSDNQSRNTQHRNLILFACKPKGTATNVCARSQERKHTTLCK